MSMSVDIHLKKDDKIRARAISTGCVTVNIGKLTLFLDRTASANSDRLNVMDFRRAINESLDQCLRGAEE